MGLFRDGPLSVRQGGLFLVFIGSVLLYLSFVSPLMAGRVPSLVIGIPGNVFGAAFFGTGVPFALFSDAAIPTFGLPHKPESWPLWWGAILVLLGLLAFYWLRWHVGA